MRRTASMISSSSSAMTSMRLSWIPSEKQYLAKKAEFVSTVCPISFRFALYFESICFVAELPSHRVLHRQ
jgi:hypothetical protein